MSRRHNAVVHNCLSTCRQVSVAIFICLYWHALIAATRREPPLDIVNETSTVPCASCAPPMPPRRDPTPPLRPAIQARERGVEVVRQKRKRTGQEGEEETGRVKRSMTDKDLDRNNGHEGGCKL